MKLIIATDHWGVDIKHQIIESLKGEFEIVDASQENYATDDYPDFAVKVANMVLSSDDAFGVLICGTGIGMSIAANKVDGIRCALVDRASEAELARLHNDANILAISAKMELDIALECIRLFAKTSPSQEEKYVRRIEKIIKIENGAYDEL